MLGKLLMTRGYMHDVFSTRGKKDGALHENCTLIAFILAGNFRQKRNLKG